MRIRRAIISPLHTRLCRVRSCPAWLAPAVAVFTSNTPVVAVAAAKPMVYMHS